MTHPNLEAHLDAYLDGELAAADARALEAHVADCAECTRFRDSRLALRATIRAGAKRLEAPAALQDRLRAQMRSASPQRAGVRARAPLVWRTLALAASLAAVALGGWQLGLQMGAGEALADAVLTTHIRSLMPGHLTDVESSDQHTVKPWFNGKLDYSPPVYDFAARGYPLLGGRLEYINGRSVSALVYGRRQHMINVLVWPVDRGTRGSAANTRQGYHLLHWVTPEYAFWVVSDLGWAELREFQGLLQQADSATTPRPY